MTLGSIGITMDNHYGSPTINPVAVGDVLENAGGTISGSGTINAGVHNDAASLIRTSGTFSITGALLNLGTVETSGTLSVTGGVLNLGTLRTDTGSLNVTGTIDQRGGGIIQCFGTSYSSVSFTMATVIGGSIVDGSTATNPQNDTVGFNQATLDGSTTVTLSAPVFMSGTNWVEGTVINNRSISLSGSLVVVGPTLTLSGSGTLAFQPTTSYQTSGIVTAAAAGTVLINNGNTIGGAVTIGRGDGMLSFNNAAGLVAAGGFTVVINAPLTNTGTLIATASYLYAGNNSIDVLSGTWTANYGGGIVLADPGGFSTIAGTLVLASNGALYGPGTNGAVLTNSSLAPETIAAGGTLQLLAGGTFGILPTAAGSIVTNGTTFYAGTVLPFTNSGVIGLSGGTAVLEASVNNLGKIFGNGTVINGSAGFANSGTLEAEGGLLTLNAPLSGGQVSIDTASTLELAPYGRLAAKIAFADVSSLLRLDVVDRGGSYSTFGAIGPVSFGGGGTIEIAGTLAGGGVYPGSGSIVDDGNTLSFVVAGSTIGSIAFAGGTAGLHVTQDAAHDTFITACFRAGTRIATTRGEVAVEALAVGDVVVTAAGERRPVRWLGHHGIDCRDHPEPDLVLPVRVCADAFGRGLPASDLWLSPGHAVCVDLLGEMLVPIGHLANGATIVQEEVEHVVYWHVELDTHDLLLANGMPAESYIDVGNRAFFCDGGGGPDGVARTLADYCRPLIQDPAILDFLHARLLARATTLGWAVEALPQEPQLLVDGTLLQPEMAEGLARFLLPADARAVWLVTPSFVPRFAGINADRRTLGLAVTGIRVTDGLSLRREMDAGDPLLCVGFHAAEPCGRVWTTGRALLPAALWQGCHGACFLTVAFEPGERRAWRRAVGGAGDAAAPAPLRLVHAV